MSRTIETVAVCGAGGTMGAGIAIVAARAGLRTICQDVSAESLGRAMGQMEAFFAKSVERGKMTAADKDAVMACLTRTTSLDDLVRADLVIEAVFEDLATKRQLFSALNVICPAHTSSPPTPRPCLSPRSRAARAATTAWWGCTSACRRSSCG
jgi:3-hydroxybutyryl-CoA dehydrogenase